MPDSAVRETFVRELLALLSERVDYCVLHGYESLPRVGSDLDLAVLPEHYSVARATVCATALCLGGRLLKDVRYDTGNASYLIVGLPDGSVAVVDMLFDARPDGAYALTATELLEGRRRMGFFYFPAPEAEAEYLLTKRSLKGDLRAEQLARIRGMAAFPIPADIAGAMALGRSRVHRRRQSLDRARVAALKVRKLLRRALLPVGDYFDAGRLGPEDDARLSGVYRRVVHVPDRGRRAAVRWLAEAPIRRAPLHAYLFEGGLPGIRRLGDRAVLEWLRTIG